MADQHTRELHPQQEYSKATTTNKTKSYHVQPKDTQIKLTVAHITR
jgi:hypothetical protein